MVLTTEASSGLWYLISAVLSSNGARYGLQHQDMVPSPDAKGGAQVLRWYLLGTYWVNEWYLLLPADQDEPSLRLVDFIRGPGSCA